MSRFFVLVVILAAAIALLKFTIRVEGTRTEKLIFLGETSKQVILGKKIPRYAGRHWVRKKLFA